MMLPSFRAPLVAAALLASTLGAWAQQPSATHLTLARELIGLTGAVYSVDELMPGFTAEIRKQTITRPDLVKDLDVVLKALQPELDAQRQQVIEAVAKTYAKYFTEAELRDVVTFFKTPSGAKYIKAQPDLIDEVVDNIQVWAQHTSEYTISRVRTEMAKKGHQMQ